MTDAALRAHERAARARPDDAAAGWAYARGLERAGERRAVFAELCRLARLGDVEAADAVDAWLPGAGGTAPPRLAGLRDGRDVRLTSLDGRGLAPPVARVLPVGPRRLVALLDQALVVLDLEARAVETLSTTAQQAALVGDDLLALVGWSTTRAHLGPAGRRLPEPGVELGPVAWSAVSRDRALLIDAGSPTARALDLADPRRTLWTARVEDGTPVAGGGLALWGTDDAGVVARSFETGVEVWRAVPGAASEGRGVPGVQADAHGVVVTRDFLGDDEEETFVSELDLATGHTRWTALLPLVDDVARTPELVLLRDELPGQQRVVALERRAGGRERWRAQWPDPAAGHFGRETAWAVGDGAVYLASVDRGTSPRLVFTALALADGRLTTLEVALPNPFSLGEPDECGVGLAVDGARVSVVVTSMAATGALAVVELADR